MLMVEMKMELLGVMDASRVVVVVRWKKSKKRHVGGAGCDGSFKGAAAGRGRAITQRRKAR